MTAWPFAPLRPHRYGVILADPAWKFLTWSEKGQGKSPSRHYDVMLPEDIMALPVAELATADAVLMLWFPQNFGEQAYAVARAWGFEPKTLGAWAKQSSTGKKWQFGTGYLLRSAAEFFLLGTRGTPRQAIHSERNLIVDECNPSVDECNLIVAPVREHSRKPDEMHRKLERMFPDIPRCELFARRPVSGWDVWGSEVGQ